jgi:hypothetical protein
MEYFALSSRRRLLGKFDCTRARRVGLQPYVFLFSQMTPLSRQESVKIVKKFSSHTQEYKKISLRSFSLVLSREHSIAIAYRYFVCALSLLSLSRSVCFPHTLHPAPERSEVRRLCENGFTCCCVSLVEGSLSLTAALVLVSQLCVFTDKNCCFPELTTMSCVVSFAIAIKGIFSYRD